MPTDSGACLAAVDAAESSLAARPCLDTSPSKLQKNALIGKGGFGLVYRCTHLSGAEFALKQIHKGRAVKRPLGAKLVAREIAAHEALPPHPFVVAMHRCWQDDRSVYLLLELCACTLFDALFLHGDRNYRLPEASAKMYVASVALALRHLHRAGFVFRDLKLENVLLDPTGQLKLADLGSAKRISDTPGQRLMTEIGTQSYLPPEQVGGRGRNSAGDLWALGVLAYEMLAGEPGPFETDDVGDDAPSRLRIFAAATTSQERVAALTLAISLTLTNPNPNPNPNLTPTLTLTLSLALTLTLALLSQERVAAYAAAPGGRREAIRRRLLECRTERGGAHAADAVVGLLQPSEAKRLGCGALGFASLLEHTWFDGFDWSALVAGRVSK